MASSTTYQDDPWAFLDAELLPAPGSPSNLGLDAASTAPESWRTYATAPTAATNAAQQNAQSYHGDGGFSSFNTFQRPNVVDQNQLNQPNRHHLNVQYGPQHGGTTGEPYGVDPSGYTLPQRPAGAYGTADFNDFQNNLQFNEFFPELNRMPDGSEQLLMQTALPIRNFYPASSEFRSSQHQQFNRTDTNTFYSAVPSQSSSNFQQSIDSSADTLLYDGRAAVDRGPNFVSSPLTPETSGSDPDTPPAQWVYYTNQFTGPGLTAYQTDSPSLHQTQYHSAPMQRPQNSYSQTPGSSAPHDPQVYNTYQINPHAVGVYTSSNMPESRPAPPPQSAYQTEFKWVQENVTSNQARITAPQPTTYHQHPQPWGKVMSSNGLAKNDTAHRHGHMHEHPHYAHHLTDQWVGVDLNPSNPTSVLPSQSVYQQDAQFWNPMPNPPSVRVAPVQAAPHSHPHTHPHAHPDPSDQAPAPDGSANLKAVTRRPKRRTGPLSRAARDKADFLRLLGACWRCRRYRKSCNDAEVCDTCLTTTEFRLWPSELGCRRGQLEDLAEPLMPKHAEIAFSHLDMTFEKKPNWRIVRFNVPNHDFNEGDKYQRMLWMVMGTRLFGDEFIELSDIVVNYQKTFKSALIDAACGHLMAACSFYHAFIATDAWFPEPDFAQIIKDFRAHSSILWKTYLRSALSGRRTDWFPLFLSSILTLFSVVIWTDAANAMPASLRNELWEDITGSIMGLRSGIYIVCLNLLNILTKGIKPWKLPIWTIEEVEQPDGTFSLKRNEEGMKLLNNDAAAFDGVMAFKKWLNKYEDVIIHDGKIWFSVKPFTRETLRPIGVLSRILDL
ncbi:hypothetical protein F5884DRAFT_746587 [Xylogone sp. PMI_703]|nr:hypothetical protein F5884DRAFT_746587 [Xylogone sp. PMI_703]